MPNAAPSPPSRASAPSAPDRSRVPPDAGGGSDTRTRILDVAEALFAENGFAGTSVRDIAARADLTPASLYNHFDGKEALYGAVLERGIQPLVNLMADFDGSDPVDFADRVLEAVMEHLRQRPHLPRLILYESVAGGSRIARLARDWARPLVGKAVADLRQAGGAGWAPEEQPLVVAAWVQLVLGHFALAPLLAETLGTDPLAPASIRRQTDFLRRLARRLMAPTAPEAGEGG